MAFDSSRPFPLILNKSLNIAALLRRKDGDKEGIVKPEEKAGKKKKVSDELDFAMVQVPRVLKRVVELPPRRKDNGIETITVRYLVCL